MILPDAEEPLSGICSGELDCFVLLRRTRNDEDLVERFHIQLLQSCTAGGRPLPPVSPEVIHIKPLSWLPLTVRSSCRAFPPPERILLVGPSRPSTAEAFFDHRSGAKVLAKVVNALTPSPSRHTPHTSRLDPGC